MEPEDDMRQITAIHEGVHHCPRFFRRDGSALRRCRSTRGNEDREPKDGREHGLHCDCKLLSSIGLNDAQTEQPKTVVITYTDESLLGNSEVEPLQGLESKRAPVSRVIACNEWRQGAASSRATSSGLRIYALIS